MYTANRIVIVKGNNKAMCDTKHARPFGLEGGVAFAISTRIYKVS